MYTNNIMLPWENIQVKIAEKVDIIYWGMWNLKILSCFSESEIQYETLS
jgi:hypothetical protein